MLPQVEPNICSHFLLLSHILSCALNCSFCCQEEALDGEDLAPALTMASLLPEPADTCPDLRKEYEGKKIVLKNLEDGILGDLCGDEDDLKCTKLVVTSDGPSAVMQGTRWFLLKSKITKSLESRLGLYFLWGWHQHDEADKYPSYFRPVTLLCFYKMRICRKKHICDSGVTTILILHARNQRGRRTRT